MPRRFTVKGPGDELIAAGEDLDELIESLKEQNGMADAEELADRYDF